MGILTLWDLPLSHCPKVVMVERLELELLIEVKGVLEGVHQRPHIDLLMGVNSYPPHEDPRFPESKLHGILDQSINPLLPNLS